jgi:hypothetical protein
MDCAAEERLVRMALESRPEIRRVDANLAAREVVVVHQGAPDGIAALIRPLNFGGEIVETTKASDLDAVAVPSQAEEARTLKIVLAPACSPSNTFLAQCVVTGQEMWLRGRDLNPRPLGYEPNELPDCSTPRYRYVRNT